MSHDHDTQQGSQDGGYDWSDPHHFHHGEDAQAGHGHDGHHVSSWQLLVGVLILLMFFTWLTVFLADQEAWIMANTGFVFTQLQNVIIAMTIATIKAMLVCMYFMHLKHDNPLNSMTLIVTFLVLGLFLLFPAMDIANRDMVNAFKNESPSPGGTGGSHLRAGGDADGASWQGPYVEFVQSKKLEKLVEEKGEAGVWYYWEHYYDGKAKKAHGKDIKRHPNDVEDMHARWMTEYKAEHGAPKSSAERTIVRTGLTPGLFEAEAPSHGNGDGHKQDADPHGTDHGGAEG